MLWSAAFFVFLGLAAFSIVVGAAYLGWWLSDPAAPLRHEALIGSGLALAYGLPVGIAALALSSWKQGNLPPWARRVSVVLLVAIVAVLAISIILSGRDT